MNKNAIRRFAIYAREELIKRVTIQAATYGVTGKDDDAGAVNAGDRVFSPEERSANGAGNSCAASGGTALSR